MVISKYWYSSCFFNKLFNRWKFIFKQIFFFLDIISEFSYESLLSTEEFILLFKTVKSEYKPKQPKSKQILAENINNKNLNRTFSSIGELSRHLKGDRGTIRNYILGRSKGLYRKQWKFTILT